VSKGGVFIHEDNRKPSPRQLHVIELIAQGLKNHREIAKKLGISQHVVRNYLGITYDKVGVSNRVDLALWYEAKCTRASFGESAPALKRRTALETRAAQSEKAGAAEMGQGRARAKIQVHSSTYMQD
jgi:DNA-binding CsgD family transcriptional regulator